MPQSVFQMFNFRRYIRITCNNGVLQGILMIISKHKDTTRLGYTNTSALVEHAWQCHHHIDWENMKILDKAYREDELLIKEALHIELAGCLIKAYNCTSRSSLWYRKWYCVMSYNTLSRDVQQYINIYISYIASLPDQVRQLKHWWSKPILLLVKKNMSNIFTFTFYLQIIADRFLPLNHLNKVSKL